MGRQKVGMRETFRQSSLISGNVPRNRSIAEIGADACTCSPTVQIMHVPWKEKRYAAIFVELICNNRIQFHTLKLSFLYFSSSSSFSIPSLFSWKNRIGTNFKLGEKGNEISITGDKRKTRNVLQSAAECHRPVSPPNGSIYDLAIYIILQGRV